jgi:hypothetical protein
MAEQVKIAAARQDQSKMDKEAMLDKLRLKPRRKYEMKVRVGDEDMTFVFSALSATELDKLKEKHPPTTKQRAEGQGINAQTFNPALVAATLTEPMVLNEEEAKEIFASDYWSTGELQQIVDAASRVCLEGLDVPSNASA